MFLLFINYFILADLFSKSPPKGTKELNAITNARRLFNSCAEEVEYDSDDVNNILSIINNEFGGWPILQGSKWNSSTFNFSQLFLKLNKHNKYVIFEIHARVNDENSSIKGIRVRLNIFKLL